MIKNEYVIGVLFVLVSGIFWGISGASGQFLLINKNFSVEWLLAMRLLCGGITLIAVMWLYKKNLIFEIFKDKKSVFSLILYSIFGIVLCQYTYFVAVKHSNAAIATVLQYTAPVYIMIYFCLLNKKLPSKKEFFALIFAISGVFFLATSGKFNLNLPLVALFFGLFSGLCIVIYTLAPISINKVYGTFTTLGLGLFIGGISVTIFSDFYHDSVTLDFHSSLAVLAVVVLGTIFSFSFYMIGVNFIGPTRASLICSIEPLSAAFFSYLWLDTKFNFYDFLGLFLIMNCVFLLSKK